jgi:hypothetical protein
MNTYISLRIEARDNVVAWGTSTSWKMAYSIPDYVIELFSIYLILPAAL